MERYGVIEEKRKREIVLLRGRGCVYSRCAFCDYHTDRCADEFKNYELNKSVLDRVRGLYGDLEIINSGSVFELDDRTLEYVKSVCKGRDVRTIHFEAHFLYRDLIERLRRDFEAFDLKLKLGLETFDYELREGVLKKGIPTADVKELCRGFDEANFLFGIKGQTEESMRRDIALGVENFERICINIMCKNSTAVSPDSEVIEIFKDRIYPEFKDDYRMDILINNTDFGVGE